MEVLQYEYELKRRQDVAHLEVIAEVSAVLRRAKDDAATHDIWLRRADSIGSSQSSMSGSDRVAIDESAFEEATDDGN